MATKHSLPEPRPFEFRLSFKQKQELRRKSAAAGISMSRYVRRAINSSYEEMQVHEWLKKNVLRSSSRT
jgi:post-segregation antitoxin (ccd killing protein)